MLSRLAYAIVGIVVVALSFSATLFALNVWSGYPITDRLTTASIPAATPVSSGAPAATGIAEETSLDTLPKLEGQGFSWIGVARLNIHAEPGTSVVTGQPILRLIATLQNAPHTLAGQFSGLSRNHVYRVTAWVKSQSGANVEFEVTDRPGGQVLNHAVAIFDLSSHAVQSGDGAVKARGLEQGPDGWQKVWLDVMTSDGQFLVALRPTNGASETYQGDGRLGLILGGVEAGPQG
jgi:hypothetical protein